MVRGEDQVTCGTRSGFVAATPRASGDTLGGSVMPVVSPVHFRQFVCSSQNPPILLRGVACQVMRPLTFSDVRSLYAGWLKSGTYSHLVGSPTFWLAYTFAIVRVLPCVRAFRKYHTLSLLIAPPKDPFTSYTFDSGVGAPSPAAFSSSVKLSPDNFSPVKFMNKAPEFLLPPVFGTTFITSPAVSDSPSPPAVVNVTS